MKSAVILCLCLSVTGCGQGIGKGFDHAAPNSAHGATGAVYTVAAGDTVYGISRKTGSTVEAIVRRNGLVAPYTLQIGQSLIVDRSERMDHPPHTSGQTHTVQTGETAYAIARRYGVSVTDLSRRNGLSSASQLRTGQRLIIPADGRIGADPDGTLPATPFAGPSEEQSVAAFAQAVNGAEIPAAPGRTGSFHWPVLGEIIAPFGKMGSRLKNDGINIAAIRGEPVKAAENGVIAYVGNEIRGYGNLVLIRHDDRYMTAYAHLDTINVMHGTIVRQGDTLGLVGATGGVARPQVHFEIREDGKPVDPLPYLNR